MHKELVDEIKGFLVGCKEATPEGLDALKSEATRLLQAIIDDEVQASVRQLNREISK